MNDLEDNKVNNIPTLSKLSAFLRLVGSLIVIAAAVCFAAQKWQDMKPWQMCSTFLGFTVVLAFMGSACRIWFKDNKGAGALFAVAAAMVPVHFTQLGGFIMNTFGKTDDMVKMNTPKAFHWTADSNQITILLTIIGVTVLAPVVYNSFKHLVPKQANAATTLYLITNAVLLLPYRTAPFVLIAALLLFVILLICDKQMFKGYTLKDLNPLLVRIMLISVPLLLMGRMYVIYDHTQFIIGISLLMCAIAFFVATNSLCENIAAAVALQVSSTAMAIIGWLFIAHDVLHDNILTHNILFIGLPIALIIFLSGMFAKIRIEIAESISYIIVILSIIADLMNKTSCITATLSIIFAILLFCRGYLKAEGYNIIISIIMLGIGLSVNFALALNGNDLMPWIVLSIVGIFIIVFASLFEKKPELFGRKKEDSTSKSVEAESFTQNVEDNNQEGQIDY